MTTLLVRHNVADYGAWRVLHDDFASLEAAQTFAASPELKEVMGRAGVVGAPETWFTNPA